MSLLLLKQMLQTSLIGVNSKDEFLKREGEKITFTPIFVDAVVKAIKDFPIQMYLLKANIIKRKHINVWQQHFHRVTLLYQ